jgi:hypothetical protein
MACSCDSERFIPSGQGSLCSICSCTWTLSERRCQTHAMGGSISELISMSALASTDKGDALLHETDTTGWIHESALSLIQESGEMPHL